jgi:hypothetical protein
MRETDVKGRDWSFLWGELVFITTTSRGSSRSQMMPRMQDSGSVVGTSVIQH